MTRSPDGYSQRIPLFLVTYQRYILQHQLEISVNNDNLIFIVHWNVG